MFLKFFPCSYILSLIHLYFHSLLFHFQLCLRFFLAAFVPRTYPMTSGGRRGAITDLLTTSRHPFRSFDTLRDSAARRQVQSLILSSHRFLWPPLLLPPLTVPCMIVFERPEDLETWPYHFSFLLLTVVSKSSYGPMARSILLRTSTFDMCSVYDMLRSLRQHLISIACIRRWLLYILTYVPLFLLLFDIFYMFLFSHSYYQI